MLLQEILLILPKCELSRVKLIASNLNPTLSVAPPQITKERGNLRRAMTCTCQVSLS